jgi:hypothetical protein
MLCFRLLNEDEPAAPLAAAVDALRTGQAAANVFDVDPTSFSAIPGTRFSYWVGNSTLSVFREYAQLEADGREVQSGASTMDDFRFLRLFWEISADTQARGRHETIDGKRWVPLAKGGSFSRYYIDWELVVDWKRDGKSMKAHVADYRGSKGWGYHWAAAINGHSQYFRPGLSWPRRTQGGLSIRVLPTGGIFGDKGPAIFAPDDSAVCLTQLLAITNSLPFRVLVSLQMAFGSYEVGVLERTPIPSLESQSAERLSELGRSAWQLKRSIDSANLVSHAFLCPSMVAERGNGLYEIVGSWANYIQAQTEAIAAIQKEIDETCFRLYGFKPEDVEKLTNSLSGGEPQLCVDSLAGDNGNEEEAEDTTPTADASAFVSELVDYAVGAAFGRWDIRYATGAASAPTEPDPFAALPFCAAGMLQNSAGLPAAPADVPANYPMRITWSGILLDDERKPEDLERRVREVLEIIFPCRADSIADEACSILAAKSLRDWLRSPSGFFATHLKRHSKSRRQAPIYWPLSSPKGLYTVWLFVHRLTIDTFFTVLRDHVRPRLEDEERHVFNLKQQAGPSATPSQARDITASEELVEDLRALRDELQRIAPLWYPDLNDGVIINHAPLWRLALHAPWRKSLKETWDALVAGDYDWAHLALHLWPERVIPKCANDRSLAIAHDLESFFWEKDPETDKWSAKKRTDSEIRALVAERNSPAVKAALESLLTAPAPSGGTSKRGRKTKEP